MNHRLAPRHLFKLTGEKIVFVTRALHLTDNPELRGALGCFLWQNISPENWRNWEKGHRSHWIGGTETQSVRCCFACADPKVQSPAQQWHLSMTDWLLMILMVPVSNGPRTCWPEFTDTAELCILGLAWNVCLDSLVICLDYPPHLSNDCSIIGQ